MRSLRGENETPMVTACSEECQSAQSVLQSASFSGRFRPQQIHASLVCRQSFPHLWKKLWKIAWNLTRRENYGAKALIRLETPAAGRGRKWAEFAVFFDDYPKK